MYIYCLTECLAHSKYVSISNYVLLSIYYYDCFSVNDIYYFCYLSDSYVCPILYPALFSLRVYILAPSTRL